MPFDIIGAKNAGYDDSEIAGTMAAKYGYDYDGASKAGHSDQEIIGHMLSKSDAGTREPTFVEKATPYVKSAWEGAKKVLGVPEGVLSTAAEFTTGQIPAITGGLAGLGNLATTGDLAKSAKTVENVQNTLQPMMTYEPKTDTGKYVKKVITSPFTALGQAADYAGGKISEAGYPNVAAGVSTGIQALPFIVGGVEGAKAKRGARPSITETPTIEHAPTPDITAMPTGPLAGALRKTAGSVRSARRGAQMKEVFNGPVTSRDALTDIQRNQADPNLAAAMAAGRETGGNLPVPVGAITDLPANTVGDFSNLQTKRGVPVGQPYSVITPEVIPPEPRGVAGLLPGPKPIDAEVVPERKLIPYNPAKDEPIEPTKEGEKGTIAPSVEQPAPAEAKQPWEMTRTEYEATKPSGDGAWDAFKVRDTTVVKNPTSADFFIPILSIEIRTHTFPKYFRTS